jgi:hypothetical protein
MRLLPGHVRELAVGSSPVGWSHAGIAEPADAARPDPWSW